MPTLLLFSDIHSDLRALKELMAMEADYYVCAGDLVNWATGFEAVGPILEDRGHRVLLIPGNHESESDISDFAKRYGLTAMHGRSMMIAGRHTGFLGYSNPTPFDTPGEYSEEELAERLEPFARLKPLIMVCHCPPLQTSLDRSRPGQHFGSGAISRFIEQSQPEWFFCGHIHEAAGVEIQIGATRARNLGKKGYVLSL